MFTLFQPLSEEQVSRYKKQVNDRLQFIEAESLRQEVDRVVSVVFDFLDDCSEKGEEHFYERLAKAQRNYLWHTTEIDAKSYEQERPSEKHVNEAWDQLVYASGENHIPARYLRSRFHSNGLGGVQYALVSREEGGEALFTPDFNPVLDTLLGSKWRELFVVSCELLQQTLYPGLGRSVYYENFLNDAYALFLYLVYKSVVGEEHLASAERFVSYVYETDFERDVDIQPEHRSIYAALKTLLAGVISQGDSDVETLLARQLARAREEDYLFLCPLLFPMLLMSSNVRLLELMIEYVARVAKIMNPVADWSDFFFRLYHGRLENFLWVVDWLEAHEWFTSELKECFVERVSGVYYLKDPIMNRLFDLMVKGLRTLDSLSLFLASDDPLEYYAGLWCGYMTDYRYLWEQILLPQTHGEETEDRYVVLGFFLMEQTQGYFQSIVAQRALTLYPDSRLILTIYIPFLVEHVPNEKEFLDWYAAWTRDRRTAGGLLGTRFYDFITTSREDALALFSGLEHLLKRQFRHGYVLKANGFLDPDELYLPQLPGQEIRSLSTELLVWTMALIAFEYPELSKRVLPHLCYIEAQDMTPLRFFCGEKGDAPWKEKISTRLANETERRREESRRRAGDQNRVAIEENVGYL